MMSEKRRWFKKPWFVVLVAIFLVWLVPILIFQTYYFVNRNIDEAVVEIGNPTVYSREDILEAVEVVKDGFYDDFPHSSIDTITYRDFGERHKNDYIEFKIEFQTPFFEGKALPRHDDGTAFLWFTCEKTEQGEWKYTGFYSGG